MSRLPRPVRLLAAGFAAVVLSGCGSGPEESAAAGSTSAEAPDARVVTTDLGDVEVPTDPQRIVVLNSALTGYLLALDLPVHATLPETTARDTLPEAWAEEATAADVVLLPWDDEGLALEAIAAEEPDLIVGGGQGFPAAQAADVYEQLTAVAPTVLVSRELTTWQQQLAFLARDLFDVPDREQALLDEYDARVEEVRAAITLPPIPVGYLVMSVDGTPFTLPEDSQLPRTLAEVGLEPAPVVAEHPELGTFGSGDSVELSREVVGQIVDAPTVFVLGFNADVTDVATLGADPLYAALPAFAGGSAHDLPYWVYRADFYRTMDTLDRIEAVFS
jgi:iron complex transport system substrate-binding protein